MSKQIVTVDIGGTHARFALAEVDGGRCVALGEEITLKTADFASFQTAWQEFGRRNASPLPRHVAMAIAGPTNVDIIRFTNNPWIIRPWMVQEKLNVDDFTLVNDFEAVGHAVAQVDIKYFERLCGPDIELPSEGTISVLGPGTGLGVAHVWRGPGGYRVQATEGGHSDFAPLDSIEDSILSRLRRRHRRVSVERVVSGPGIVDIYETLAALEGRAVAEEPDREIWQRGLDQSDSLAAAAVDRFCLSLGAVAGDLALAQGASGVVIAGGLGYRIRAQLVASGFPERFVAKGRFENFMSALPVKLITHPQPGLFGAAAAYASQHG